MKISRNAILATVILLGAVVISHAQDKAGLKSPLTQQEQQQWRKTLYAYDYTGIAKAYADYMIEHGRDVYGKVHSPLFMTVLNRQTGKPFKAPYPHVIAKPYAPGLRRDHKMRPYDRTYIGSNPLEDLPLYGLLYRLSELTGDPRYRKEADESIAWFLENGWSSKTGLPGWGSHMYYQVEKDVAVFAGGNPNGGYGGHEYNFVWPYWDQHPASLSRFAQGLWNKHIRNKETGHFNRHSNDGTSGMEFPETGSCFMDVWARAYGRNGDPEMKKYIQTLLKFFRSMRDPKTGAMSWCSSNDTGRRELSNVHMNLSMATTLQDAAKHVAKRDPELARELREFVRFIDNEYLSNDYDHILDVAGKGILGWYMVADRTASIAYGGFKDVPRQVMLVIRNTGEKTATVQVTATLHDTYHDRGQVQSEKTLKPGEEGAFVLKAPAQRWIRHLAIAGENEIADLSVDDLAFAVSPRSQLHTAAAVHKEDDRTALVFLIAGQSNAGGVAAFSPESNANSGMAEKHPTIPGTTAKEVGIPINTEAYRRSYIWRPGKQGPFEPLTPGRNLLGGYNDPNRHGIELPMAMLLEQRYPERDKYFIKHGPGGHNLHTQWAAERGPDYVSFMRDYQAAISDLQKRYDKVRVMGLYWDQGESDRPRAQAYAENLRTLFAALRRDTGIPDLQIFVRKHLFQHGDDSFTPILNAQVEVTRKDPHAHLLDLDLGSNEKNFKTWAWTDNNGHLSSKAYLELSHRIFPRKESDTWGPFVGPWKRHEENPIITLEGKETYSIQNGPQSVIQWKDKWVMFLMTSQPMVTKLAVSDDGLTWTRPHHDYLLKPEMDWEGSYNLAKAAVVRGDEVWLYYFGKKGKTEMIALARSRDLVNWQKEPKPIFTHEDSRIDGERAFPDCVLQEGDAWYMYYDVGFDYHHPKNPDGYAIGVATSTDGINWTDSPKSPVLTTSERSDDSWDDGMVSQCSVTKIGDWFYMLYSGGTNNHGRKYSGKNRMAFGLARARHPEGPWEKYPNNPIFKPTGNEKDFDGIFLQHACPVKVGNQWRLYYNGWTLNPEATNSIGAEYAIGLAFTKDVTGAKMGK